MQALKIRSIKVSYVLNNIRLLLNVLVPLIVFPYVSRILGPEGLGKVEQLTIQLMSSNTTRIAKNTLMLYFRQILIMLVSLYTVRVVLETLGSEDYGIYNVVGGIVALCSFLSNSMAGASQRYFSFEIGQKNYEQLRRVFSLNLIICIFIVILVLLFAETIGLWFINTKLVIPEGRKSAIQFIYQFSIISFLLTILSTPYMALIIAHENMDIYAYVSIIEVVLKLMIVFLLLIISLDKLQLYGILMCAVTFINATIYRTICRIKYRDCKFLFYWNTGLLKEIGKYIGWNLFGDLTTVFKEHGVTILLNQFFNPVIIASQSIASQVSRVVTSFSNNFNIALQPQIIKNYSVGQKKALLLLMSRGARGTYFLMYLFTLPLVLEMPIVLTLWLHKPPEYAVLFTRLILVNTLLNSISLPLMTAARATGKIGLYQFTLGMLNVVCFLITWLVFSLGMMAYSAMIVSIGTTIAMFVVRLVVVKRLVGFSVKQFLKETIIPAGIVTVASAVFPVMFCFLLSDGILRLCIVFSVSIVLICMCVYFWGINKWERKRVQNIIMNKIQNYQNVR
jgi:O-antigen/teichoic acid export membrane protein